MIANQYLSGTRPDLIFGGGEEVWYPEGTPGMVPDMIEDDESFGRKNLVAKAKRLGYEYAYDRETFAELDGPKALAMTRTDALLREAFIQKYNYKKDPYAVPEHEMVEKALEILEQDQRASSWRSRSTRSTTPGHEHSPKLLFSSGQELNRIAAVLKRYQREHPNTLVIVTADHETGGLGIEAHYQDGGAGVFPVADSAEHFRLDWTTPGHTGVNVPVTSIGPRSRRLEGVRDNTKIFDVARGRARARRRGHALSSCRSGSIRKPLSRVSWTVQTVSVPGASVHTSPGPTSISPPSQAIVARPSTTTNTSSASTSLNVPGVQRQTPVSDPSADSVST